MAPVRGWRRVRPHGPDRWALRPRPRLTVAVRARLRRAPDQPDHPPPEDPMTSIDPTTLTSEELAPMLRAWASGLFPSEAAVELLIAHGVWPHRRDFRFTLVDAVDDGWGPR